MNDDVESADSMHEKNRDVGGHGGNDGDDNGNNRGGSGDGHRW